MADNPKKHLKTIILQQGKGTKGHIKAESQGKRPRKDQEVTNEQELERERVGKRGQDPVTQWNLKKTVLDAHAVRPQGKMEPRVVNQQGKQYSTLSPGSPPHSHPFLHLLLLSHRRQTGQDRCTSSQGQEEAHLPCPWSMAGCEGQ